ncbi:hypothetical protein HPO_10337 [Hyphomonas polymorpha PS728]|uniref:Transmembrane protein n=1 Tax=Hyphomonas polymorpha PS728 TaxID=1280954 RepID=A0A062VFN4_9PROT|nr:MULTISPECIES: DUF6768 family protein [Hyphomonas]AXE65218.1 hypothetical protein BBF93_14075 [Hyphomonas sp. CACIAM 19H1]KCZ98295.1 hypothetical protein HPO_10337 [Hyphomonas polymorpha PS728]
MTSFETRLKESLSAEDEAFLKNLEEGESLFGQLGATFTGPMKFWTGFAFMLGFVFFLGMIWCAVEISRAASVQQVGLWLAGFVFAMVATGMIKTWFWLRMNHLATLRELKRLELRLMHRAA